jgi:hypothetical protein
MAGQVGADLAGSQRCKRVPKRDAPGQAAVRQPKRKTLRFAVMLQSLFLAVPLLSGLFVRSWLHLRNR